MTTTWSQVNSTSGSRCDDRIRLTSLLCAEVADQLEHLVAPLRVHAVGRLVEEQQIGIVDERLRQLDALLHAGRVGLDVAVARLAEADVVEHLVRALHRVDRRQARRAGRSRRRTTRRSCRECARRSPACSRGGRGSRAARSATSRPSTRIRPCVGRDEAEQRLEHRALAGAVRSEQADRAARETRALTFLQRLVLAVDDGHAVELDDRSRVAVGIRSWPNVGVTGAAVPSA